MLYIFANEEEVLGQPIVAKSKKQAIIKMQESLDSRLDKVNSNISILNDNINTLMESLESHLKDTEDEKGDYAKHVESSIEQCKHDMAKMAMKKMLWEVKAADLDCYSIGK